jgi:phosphoglycolate phosphatase
MICPHLQDSEYQKRFEGNINDWEEPINVHTEECRQDIDFFTEYISRMKNEVPVIPGMKKVIENLEKEYTLIVVSSTITSPIRDFLEEHGLVGHFTEVMGNDVHKSKVEKIKMVFEKHGVAANNCVFITDTLGDMHEAEKTGIDSIGVTWGFHTPQTLQHGNPFRLVEKPDDLPIAIASYFGEVTK